MFPVDPHGVKTHGRDESCNGYGADTEIVSQQRGDFPFMSIAKSLTSSMGLE